MKTIESLLRKNIAALAPYSTARDEYKGSIGAFLDANENPFDNGMNRYPSTALKERVRGKIANMKHVPSDMLFLGNGSDEAIDLCYRAFCEPRIDNAVMIAPSYGMYGVCADINDVECRTVPLNEDFSLPVEQLLDACDENTKLMFICSPNNPTANAFPVEQICSIADRFEGILVVDEAYIDFSSRPGMVPLLGRYSRVIVLQTLSKAWGLAGLRVGLAIADPLIISYFKKVKYPYNIGSDTLQLAERELDRDVAPQIEKILAERERVASALSGVGCVLKVFPSDANFLLVRVKDPQKSYDELITGEVIVRDRSRVQLCGGCLRITIGTQAENDRLIELMSRL